MELLLDTHAFLWWLADDGRLGPRTREAIAAPGNAVFVSAATAWEIASERASGTLEAPGDIHEWIAQSSFSELAVEVAHAVAATKLPKRYNEPFDRLLIAQAQLEGLTLVTRADEVAPYAVRVLDPSS